GEPGYEAESCLESRRVLCRSHRFTRREEDVPNDGTMCKMNPPVRTSWDKAKISEGLMDGTIDMIATDHAPHSAEEKKREFAAARSAERRAGDGSRAGRRSQRS